MRRHILIMIIAAVVAAQAGLLLGTWEVVSWQWSQTIFYAAFTAILVIIVCDVSRASRS